MANIPGRKALSRAGALRPVRPVPDLPAWARPGDLARTRDPPRSVDLVGREDDARNHRLALWLEHQETETRVGSGINHLDDIASLQAPDLWGDQHAREVLRLDGLHRAGIGDILAVQPEPYPDLALSRTPAWTATITK